MSRYFGLHRTPCTPSNRARTLAVLGTAGAVIAAPISLAGTAQAASGSTWDRLANCESGGNWSISTGNGYSGGLQFSGSTWRAYGGGAFASSAGRASRAEQIAIAEKVLDGQGWGAWPSCSRRLGLGRAEAAGTLNVSRSTQRKALVKKSVTKKSVTKTAVTKKVAKKASVKRSAKATLRLAKKRSTTTAAYGSYLVRSGDTLSRIASRKDVRGGWKSLYVKNRGAIGSNPNMIRVGQRLSLPR